MQPKNLPELSDALVIWRYLDFPKFADMVLHHRLYLARLDQLDDGMEGYFPPPSESKETIERLIRMKNPDANADPAWLYGAHNHSWAYRFLTYVTCWHESPEESYGMWKVYLGSSLGVAVKTTVAKLRDHAAWEITGKAIGAVRYSSLDEDEHATDLKLLPFRKRPEFKYESEVRLIGIRIDGVVIDGHTMLGESPPPDWPLGITSSFDGLPFIDEVRICPNAPAWFANLVRTLVQSSNLDVQVVSSELDAVPKWPTPGPRAAVTEPST